MLQASVSSVIFDWKIVLNSRLFTVLKQTIDVLFRMNFNFILLKSFSTFP